MTPAERARLIDQQEFEAECQAIRNRIPAEMQARNERHLAAIRSASHRYILSDWNNQNPNASKRKGKDEDTLLITPDDEHTADKPLTLRKPEKRKWTDGAGVLADLMGF